MTRLKSINTPVLSIIIPTTGDRIEWLQRAVNSALSGWIKGAAEVIIVLNKNITKIKQIETIFLDNPDVHIVLSTPAGVSRARNIGLDASKGALIRFLDDDDYLYSEMAIEQCDTLLKSKADISSYAIHLVNENNCRLATRYPINEDDCVIALSLPMRLQIPLSFVFKKEAIDKCRWQENLSLAEDTVFLIDLLAQKEISWLHTKNVVGVWFQHSNPRLSRRRSTHVASWRMATALIELSKNSSRLNAYRKQAISAGLWSCFASGFKYNPIQWSILARKTLALDKASFPNSRIYCLGNSLGISPILISWLLLPAFWLVHIKRLVFEKK